MDVVYASYILTVILSGFLHIIAAKNFEYILLLGSILLLSLGHFFVVIGLFLGAGLPIGEKPSVIGSYKSYLSYLITCSLLYVIITNSIDIHQLGDTVNGANVPFIEGVSELISRFLLPACGYVALIKGYFKKGKAGVYRNIYFYLFLMIVCYSVYVDIFIKFSKQVAITWILVLYFANTRIKLLKIIHVLAMIVIVLSAFSYITFTRILSYDELGADGIFDSEGPISFVADVIYQRLVGVNELSNLLKYGVDIYDFKFSLEANHSIANFYTREIYGHPLDGGHSSAPGFVGFFLYCFGYVGIFCCIFVGFFCSLIFKLLHTFGDVEYARITASLLLLLLMIDGTLDERLFSLFPIKLILLHSTILIISRFRLLKRSHLNKVNYENKNMKLRDL